MTCSDKQLTLRPGGSVLHSWPTCSWKQIIKASNCWFTENRGAVSAGGEGDAGRPLHRQSRVLVQTYHQLRATQPVRRLQPDTGAARRGGRRNMTAWSQRIQRPSHVWCQQMTVYIWGADREQFLFNCIINSTIFFDNTHLYSQRIPNPLISRSNKSAERVSPNESKTKVTMFCRCERFRLCSCSKRNQNSDACTTDFAWGKDNILVCVVLFFLSPPWKRWREHDAKSACTWSLTPDHNSVGRKLSLTVPENPSLAAMAHSATSDELLMGGMYAMGAKLKNLWQPNGVHDLLGLNGT